MEEKNGDEWCVLCVEWNWFELSVWCQDNKTKLATSSKGHLKMPTTLKLHLKIHYHIFA